MGHSVAHFGVVVFFLAFSFFFTFASLLPNPDAWLPVYQWGLYDFFLCFYAASVAYDLLSYFLYLIPLQRFFFRFYKGWFKDWDLYSCRLRGLMWDRIYAGEG